MTAPTAFPSDRLPAASPDSACSRPRVAGARRVVVKLGTRVLTNGQGEMAAGRVASLLATVVGLSANGRQVILVTSGAVGLGRAVLGLESAPRDGALRQACAAVGQARMVDLLRRTLAGAGRLAAQVLVAQGDFDDRARTLRLRDGLEALLARGVVPLVNENDAVARERLRVARQAVVFDDNDHLAALVAAGLGADLLVLLTDVAGVYRRDPRHCPGDRPMARAEALEVRAEVGGPGSAGRGGMKSKVAAAELACRAGCEVVIASGLEPGVFSQVMAGEEHGTWFPGQEKLEARRRWIATSGATRGVLHLDQGAVDALGRGGASLLAAGVERIDGDWAAGDVVELRAPGGRVIGRARCPIGVSAARRRRRRGRPTRRHSSLLIRRDAIVLDL